MYLCLLDRIFFSLTVVSSQQLPNCWTEHRRLAVDLHLEHAKCLHLLGRFEAADRKFSFVSTQCATQSERVDALMQQAMLCVTMNRCKQACEYASHPLFLVTHLLIVSLSPSLLRVCAQCLLLLGEPINLKVTENDVNPILQQAVSALQERMNADIAQLASGPEAPGAAGIVIRCLAGLATCAYMFDINLCTYVSAKGFLRALQDGLCPGRNTSV